MRALTFKRYWVKNKKMYFGTLLVTFSGTNSRSCISSEGFGALTFYRHIGLQFSRRLAECCQAHRANYKATLISELFTMPITTLSRWPLSRSTIPYNVALLDNMPITDLKIQRTANRLICTFYTHLIYYNNFNTLKGCFGWTNCQII